MKQFAQSNYEFLQKCISPYVAINSVYAASNDYLLFNFNSLECNEIDAALYPHNWPSKFVHVHVLIIFLAL